MIAFLKPAPHAEPLPPERIDPEYRRLRLQVFAGIFLGYAAFYLVRKNFSLAMPDILRATLGCHEQVKQIAERYYQVSNMLYLGRQYLYPLALEAALGQLSAGWIAPSASTRRTTTTTICARSCAASG